MSDQIEEMNDLHVRLGQQAARLAMEVLEATPPSDIPVATAVSLLKFGVDLERKALLGTESDEESDPFAALLNIGKSKGEDEDASTG